MHSAEAAVVTKDEGAAAQARHLASAHGRGQGLSGRRTPEGILLAADELGLTDVQKGRLVQIAERARADAEAVLTPEQRQTLVKLAEALPACGCGHTLADTPAASQHPARGLCQCRHCVAVRGDAAGSLEH
jgi:Spy/CpxP family protein refolding chaperone